MKTIDADAGYEVSENDELRYEANKYFPIQLPGEEPSSFLVRKWSYWLDELNSVSNDLDKLQSSVYGGTNKND